MSTPKCPHCGAGIDVEWPDRDITFKCESELRCTSETVSQSLACLERTARQNAEADLAKAYSDKRDAEHKASINDRRASQAETRATLLVVDLEETRRKLEESTKEVQEQMSLRLDEIEQTETLEKQLAETEKERLDLSIKLLAANLNESKLAKQLSETRRKLEEVTSFVWGAVHNARPECGSAMARWVCVKISLGVGSTTAVALCHEHGVDPHEVLKSRCDYSEEAQKGGAS